MQENMMSEFIKEGMSIVNSSVSAVVGALISTLFLRKNTQISEFEKIKAGKFNDVVDELLSSGKMTYLEYYKCRNFLDIAKKADEMLAKEEYPTNNFLENNYDFDWFVRYFDYASNIGNEEMQKLWASILKGEIKNPGTTTLSLLHSLSMMRKEQAELFCNISRFALMDLKNHIPHLLLFVASNRDAYKSSGITPGALKELERLGLIECDFSSEFVFLYRKTFRTGNNVVTIYGDPDNMYKIKAGNVNFTKDGQILYSIIDSQHKKYRSDILDFTITKFKRRNCRVVINEREIR